MPGIKRTYRRTVARATRWSRAPVSRVGSWHPHGAFWAGDTASQRHSLNEKKAARDPQRRCLNFSSYEPLIGAIDIFHMRKLSAGKSGRVAASAEVCT